MKMERRRVPRGAGNAGRPGRHLSLKPPRPRPAGRRAADDKANRCFRRWPGPRSNITMPAQRSRGRAGPTVSGRARHHGREHRRFTWASRPIAGIGLLKQAPSTTFSPASARNGRPGRRRQQDGGSYYDRFRGRVLFSIRDAQGAAGGHGRPRAARVGRRRARPNTSTRPKRRCSRRASCSTASISARDAIREDGTRPW